ncbi:MAG: hypothetical protein A2888_00535 [Chlamydiae bacterium RIFCSPLOWO2_01_FULL_28_7]|nr:MAG: hypothetical protein A2888_00535 [Chlamydiae bacterium RIFCSPLOWO2_01_FULL_28_7]
MTDFDKKTLKNLQRLAKIKLSDEEEEEFSIKLKSIIEYIDSLNEVDTAEVVPCNYVLLDLQKNIFSEDIAENTLSREDLLKNAPDRIGGMIKAPLIINKE